MEATLVGDSHDGSRNGWLLNLSYNTRRLQSLNEALFSCLQATGSWVHGSLRQHGQGNEMVLQLSMSIATTAGEL